MRVRQTRRIALRAGAGRALRLALVGATIAFEALASPPQKPGNVEVTLLSERAAILAGRPFWVGLRMRHDPHWHTYWRNPGDAGIPTSLSWKLPPGFQAGEIEWPFPSRLQRGPLASFAYEGTVLLPVMIFPPRTLLAGQSVNLAATANWLECMENCIPREAKLDLQLAVASAPAKAGSDEALFRAARAALPQALEGARGEAERRGDAIEIRLALPHAGLRKGQLFLEQEDVVDPGAIPVLSEQGGIVTWASRLTPRGKRLPPGSLTAVWVAAAPTARPRALRLDVSLR